jgi:hypothetical protein
VQQKAAHTAEPDDDTSIPVADRVSASLVDAGDEPRGTLLLTVVPADAVPFVLTASNVGSVRTGPQELPVPRMPPLSIEGRARVRPLPAGGGRVRMHITEVRVLDDAEVAPGVIRSLRAKASALPEIDAEFEFAADGSATSARIDTGPTERGFSSIAAAEREHLRGMLGLVGFESLVRPTEPIGIGGRWTWITHRNDTGLSFDDTRVVRVVERDGTRARVELDFEQSATDLRFVPPWAPNTTIMAKSLQRRGTGFARIDTGSPLPLEQHAEVELDVELEVEAQGQLQAVSMQLELSLDLRTGSALSEGESPRPQPKGADSPDGGETGEAPETGSSAPTDRL